MIDEIFKWFGMLAYYVAAGIAILIAFGWIAEGVNRLWDRVLEGQRSYERVRLGNQLISDSWWFSENGEVSGAVRLIGEAMVRNNGDGYDVSRVREQWRTQVSAKKAGQNER
jgi:hypothetical protein